MNMIYNTAGNRLKQYYASPLCLMAFIFGCGYFLLSVVSVFFGANGAASDLLESISQGNPYLQNDMLKPVQSSTIVSGIISCIVIGLLVAGIGLIYFMSKGNGSPSAGFTIIQVYGILGIILSALMGLLIILFIILGAVMLAGGSFLSEIFKSYDFSSIYQGTNLDYGDFGDYGDFDFGEYGAGVMDMAMPIITTVFIVLMIVCIIAFVLILLYSINTTKFAGSMKKGLREPYLHVKGATFFGVVSVIIGAFTLLGSITGAGMVMYNLGFAMVELLGGLCCAGMYITFGLAAAGFKKYAVRTNSELEMQYNQYAQSVSDNRPAYFAG